MRCVIAFARFYRESIKHFFGFKLLCVGGPLLVIGFYADFWFQRDGRTGRMNLEMMMH